MKTGIVLLNPRYQNVFCIEECKKSPKHFVELVEELRSISEKPLEIKQFHEDGSWENLIFKENKEKKLVLKPMCLRITDGINSREILDEDWSKVEKTYLVLDRMWSPQKDIIRTIIQKGEVLISELQDGVFSHELHEVDVLTFLENLANSSPKVIELKKLDGDVRVKFVGKARGIDVLSLEEVQS